MNDWVIGLLVKNNLSLLVLVKCFVSSDEEGKGKNGGWNVEVDTPRQVRHRQRPEHPHQSHYQQNELSKKP